jgi:ribonuclease E
VAQEPAEPDRAPSEAGHPGEIGVEPGGRKRRRRGRRGGRRRRRGNEQPGQEGMPVAGAGPRDAPIAEQVEYVAAPMPAETIAPAIEEPLRPPAALVPELGADSVPIVERGDSAAPAARARSESGEEPPRHAVSTELSTHEIHSPPAKPKRGWWRRVIDS